jgi:plasmid stability protein
MEKDKTKALLIKMDSEMHKALKVRAAEQGINMTNIILKLVQNYLGDEVTASTDTEAAIEKNDII